MTYNINWRILFMKKNIRISLIMLIFAFMVLIPAGCRGKDTIGNDSSDSSTQSVDKEETIRVASTFTGADPYTNVWQQVLRDFQTEFPGIKVIDESTGAGGDVFKTKVNTDFASGNEPDVTYGFNGALGKPIVDSGKVITWDEELKADPEWAANFKTDFLEMCKYKGKLYALPFISFFEGMWVNRDLFQNNGLEVPKTYDDIIKAIPVLKAQNIIPIVCAFSDEPHYIIETFILSMGGKDGHANPFDSSWAPALKMIKELYDLKAFSDDALTIKQGNCSELFADKKAAMFISGSWSRGKFKDFENTVVIPLPMVPGGKADPTDIIGGAGTGWYLVRDLNDQKNGAGMKFVKYMTQPEVVAKFASTAGVSCINCEVGAKTPTEQSENNLVNNAKSINGAVGDALGQEVFGSIWHGLSFIVTGTKSPEQVLDEAKKLIQ
jgi:raffinose/stachyose/melibiose transport system substrate-binding protein